MAVLTIPFPAFDPVLVQIGPFAIRWYALAYIFGILLGWLYARALVANVRLWGGPAPMCAIDFDDFVLWVTLGIIVGGRTGFTGCVIAVMLFGLRRGIPMLSLGDITCAVGPIGLFLGRIANFINSELWGRPSDVPWAMVFPNGGRFARHPSQLYEAALEGLVLFFALTVAMRAGALRRPGLIIGLFAVGYAIARIICEFFREPDAQLGFLWGGLTMGMLLSVPLMLAGFGFIAYALRHAPLRVPEP
jgi:phosphatidylglycerol:prolipoprotein diacylglycerol transferase